MKPKVKMGLCYPSGSGGMFLTELIYPTPIEESGNYPTNPGCHRSVSHNEYGGARECVFVDNTNEALEVNENSILVAKLNIHKYLPFYNCPMVIQIDVSDDESFSFTQELFFMKKYLGGYPQFQKFEKEFEESGLSDLLSKYKTIHRYSKVATDILRTHRERGYPLDDDLVKGQVRTIYKEYLDRGQASRYNEKKQWDRNTNVDRSSVYYPEKISEYSELRIVNYNDLFLKGKSTGTLFDNYKEEISDYTERNWELIETFEKEFL